MEAKILNYADALRLASILTEYVIPEDWGTSNNEFVGKLIEMMSPMDFLNCLKLLSSDKITGEEGGENYIKLLHSGFEKNKVLTLIEHYRRIGIK